MKLDQNWSKRVIFAYLVASDSANTWYVNPFGGPKFWSIHIPMAVKMIVKDLMTNIAGLSPIESNKDVWKIVR